MPWGCTSIASQFGSQDAMAVQPFRQSPQDAEQQATPIAQSSRPHRVRAQASARQPWPLGAHVPQLGLQQYSPASQYFPPHVTPGAPPAPPDERPAAPALPAVAPAPAPPNAAPALAPAFPAPPAPAPPVSLPAAPATPATPPELEAPAAPLMAPAPPAPAAPLMAPAPPVPCPPVLVPAPPMPLSSAPFGALDKQLVVTPISDKASTKRSTNEERRVIDISRRTAARSH